MQPAGALLVTRAFNRTTRFLGSGAVAMICLTGNHFVMSAITLQAPPAGIVNWIAQRAVGPTLRNTSHSQSPVT